MTLALELRENRLEALLEVAPVLGSGHQAAQVQRIDDRIGQNLRNLAVHDLLRQTFGDRRLADTGLADEQRVVLAPPTEDLHRTLDLVGTTDQGVDPPLPGHLVQIRGEVLERTAPILFLAARLVDLAGRVVFLILPRHLGDPVRDVVDDIQARHVLLVEEVNGLRVLLAEERHQHVGARHLLLARGLHVENRTLQDSLKPERRLGIAILVVGDEGCRFVYEGGDFAAQPI